MTEETIFAAALELRSAERGAYLARVCGDDADMRKRLEGLLAASGASLIYAGYPSDPYA